MTKPIIDRRWFRSLMVVDVYLAPSIAATLIAFGEPGKALAALCCATILLAILHDRTLSYSAS